MLKNQDGSLKPIEAPAAGVSAAGPVLSLFGEPSTIQIESTRKAIAHAKVICQVSKMLCWEAAELCRTAQESCTRARALRQELKRNRDSLRTGSSARHSPTPPAKI